MAFDFCILHENPLCLVGNKRQKGREYPTKNLIVPNNPYNPCIQNATPKLSLRLRKADLGQARRQKDTRKKLIKKDSVPKRQSRMSWRRQPASHGAACGGEGSVS
jgi:hypothetical protein